KQIEPNTEILFVGAEGRMEMEKVPAAGYQIKGLPVVGFQRNFSVKNLAFPFKLMRSMNMARRIVKNFKPDVAIGVGGYASGPVLKVAQQMKIPTLIQEQNSHAGVTNKLLAKKANAICVAYENMEQYFPAEKITITGNPIRQGLNNITPKSDEAKEFFNIQNTGKVILVVGGSLGAKSINHSLLNNIEQITNQKDVTLIWQTGKFYFDEITESLKDKKTDNVRVLDFISRMDLAYSIADLVISRAGACTISELCLVGKPTILVPSPNVAEDHQTMNAKALAQKDAAIMVKDADAQNSLVSTAINTIQNDNKLAVLAKNIGNMALPDAANSIAKIVLNLTKK
ncbi:MAG TPA: undecaprenyldiphospho-muramoylpentapeptide beta-N-acetylglucosaminyltransferase, partial [Perlabentimonas sp.]|nr:undecaprenyldiphospho-muramoylpentapeptide beta-N-acetylglucosaminyltransferase [Perlabentimonas sp.]